MATATTAMLPAFLAPRHKAIRELLREHKLDAILLTHDSDLAYVTDFTGEDSIGIVTPDTVQLVTDFRFKEQAEIEAPWLSVVLRDGKMSDALIQALLNLKVVKVGFEANLTRYGQISSTEKALAELIKDGKVPSTTKVDFVPLDSVLVHLRKAKDAREIGIIRKAVEIAEQGFVAMRAEVKPGVSENYLAGFLAFQMRILGASDSSFQSIVATGANASLPHYRPKETKVLPDQVLLVDWGARYQGYCSDLTRTLLLGKVPAKMREIYQIVLDAQLAAIAVLKPGAKTIATDAVAREYITKAGYGDFFGHSLGHGIGRDVHEGPSLRKTPPDDELKPGHIVTVEPGIYLPGVGGVRIEENVLITETGHEVLSKLPRRLEDMLIG